MHRRHLRYGKIQECWSVYDMFIYCFHSLLVHLFLLTKFHISITNMVAKDCINHIARWFQQIRVNLYTLPVGFEQMRCFYGGKGYPAHNAVRFESALRGNTFARKSFSFCGIVLRLHTPYLSFIDSTCPWTHFVAMTP